VTEVTETADPLAGFAALMGAAGQEASPVTDVSEAPYGYTRDEATGEMRPKKSPGRPRKSPSLDDLKAQREAAVPAPDESRDGDRAPAAPKSRRGRRASKGPAPDRPAPPVPQHLRSEGAIAKGVNQLYRKAGKLVRVMDQDIGQALIDITRAEDADDVTVGDAWEQLARTNPRVKAFLMRMLAGGAWSGLVAAHAPVFMALLMKDSIRRRIPFARLAMAMVDDEGEPGEAPAAGTPFDGLRPEDMAAMMAMAQATAEQMMSGRGPDVPARGEQ
jgi:hypothetical protein